MEREVRLKDRHAKEQMSDTEYLRDIREVNALIDEIDKRGTDRDKLTLELYTETILEAAGMPVVVYPRNMSLQEFQQFRSKVEPMSDEEIREDIRKAKEELERNIKERTSGFGPPQGGIQV